MLPGPGDVLQQRGVPRGPEPAVLVDPRDAGPAAAHQVAAEARPVLRPRRRGAAPATGPRGDRRDPRRGRRSRPLRLRRRCRAALSQHGLHGDHGAAGLRRRPVPGLGDVDPARRHDQYRRGRAGDDGRDGLLRSAHRGAPQGAAGRHAQHLAHLEHRRRARLRQRPARVLPADVHGRPGHRRRAALVLDVPPGCASRRPQPHPGRAGPVGARDRGVPPLLRVRGPGPQGDAGHRGRRLPGHGRPDDVAAAGVGEPRPGRVPRRRPGDHRPDAQPPPSVRRRPAPLPRLAPRPAGARHARRLVPFLLSPGSPVPRANWLQRGARAAARGRSRRAGCRRR